MPRSPVAQIAKANIVPFFQKALSPIYSRTDIDQVLLKNRRSWRIPQDLSTHSFLDYLLEHTKLQRVELKSQIYRSILRYTWGPVSPYQLALSLRPNAYLSHESAMFLHRITRKVPTKIYVNKEQTPKHLIARALTQEAIDSAFSRPQRFSNYVYKYDKRHIVLIAGKHTGQLGVGEMRGPKGERLKATGLERTLIDITVRPAYAGGVRRVLEAFESAKDRVRVDVLIRILKKLDHIYPYHQAVGFYMGRAGYNTASLKKLRDLGLTLDFYLAHGMSTPKHDSDWRLYYSSDL